jgi:hypothetical protein
MPLKVSKGILKAVKSKRYCFQDRFLFPISSPLAKRFRKKSLFYIIRLLKKFVLGAKQVLSFYKQQKCYSLPE